MTGMSSCLSRSIPKPKNSNKQFVFIEVAKTGRVTNKKDLHRVRNHIMKDIGMARRKQVPSTEVGNPERGANVKTTLESQIEDSLTEEVQVPLLNLGDWSLGSGRMDPFASYPVPVNSDMLFLVDHGKLKAYSCQLLRHLTSTT